MNLNGKEYFYIRNLMNDIIGLIDSNGTQVVSYQYDVWENPLNISGSLKDTVGKKNPYRYRGYRYDEETGYYYLQSRYYLPEWGRFLNADSEGGEVGALLSHNVFSYSLNNPVNLVDPSGFRPIEGAYNPYGPDPQPIRNNNQSNSIVRDVMRPEVIIVSAILVAVISQDFLTSNKDLGSGFVRKKFKGKEGYLQFFAKKNWRPLTIDDAVKAGFKPNKKFTGEKVRVPSGKYIGRFGWEDKKGNIWVPAKAGESHGGLQFDVQLKKYNFNKHKNVFIE
jgi:RHS repeat-associated protein